MHARGSAEGNLQKLTRACGQLLEVTPDHSAPLVVHTTGKLHCCVAAAVAGQLISTPAARGATARQSPSWPDVQRRMTTAIHQVSRQSRYSEFG